MTSMRSFALTPGRLILLIILFLLAVFAAILTYLPAAWVWAQARPYVALPPMVTVEAVGGTVWSGTGLLTVRAAGIGSHTLRLGWDASLPDLGGWPLRWRIETRQSWLEGDMVLKDTDAAGLTVENGLVSLDEFSNITRQNGLILPGSITISGLELQVERKQVVMADGYGRWAGGTVRWEAGSQVGQADLPPLVAKLQEQGGGVVVDIVTEAGEGQLVDLAITPEGLATMAVRRRLPELAGMQVGSGAADDTVFRLQTRLIP